MNVHLGAEVESGLIPEEQTTGRPRRSGRAGAGEFFSSLSALDISKFVPKRFFEGPDLVVVLLDLEATVKANGRRIREEDEVHIWYFDEKNRVTRFRHRADTQQHLAACRGA